MVVFVHRASMRCVAEPKTGSRVMCLLLRMLRYGSVPSRADFSRIYLADCTALSARPLLDGKLGLLVILKTLLKYIVAHCLKSGILNLEKCNFNLRMTVLLAVSLRVLILNQLEYESTVTRCA